MNEEIVDDCLTNGVDLSEEKTNLLVKVEDDCDKNRKGRRAQKYRQSWKEDFPWLLRDTSSHLRARCLTCKKGMNAHKTILKRHEASSKHKRNLKSYTGNNLIDEGKTAIITVPSEHNPLEPENISITYATSSKDCSLNRECNQGAIQVCFMVDPHISSIPNIINRYIPEPEATEVKRVIYGRPQKSLHLSAEILNEADEMNFELKAFKFSAAIEELSAPRIVRIGIIQNEVVLDTMDPVAEQRDALHSRLNKIMHTAHLCGVNIICLQEAWTMPFAFCNKEKLPWCEFAENANNGPTTQLCQKWSKEYNMVIISPIIERDEVHGDMLWNTAVVISESGRVIGQARKNHISRIGNFIESNFYSEGNAGNPVFQTKYGKIAVNIGDGSHVPHSWMMYGLNGAEIVFNPSAATYGLGEQMWGIDARSAAITNGFFTCSLNRVGKECFFSETQLQMNYFGSSFISAPDGSRTPELSRVRDGLLVAEIDLNLCRQIKDRCGLRNTQRLGVYIEELKKVVSPNYEPNLIKDI